MGKPDCGCQPCIHRTAEIIEARFDPQVRAAATNHAALRLADWFASLQMEVENDMVGPRFELFSMLTQAAIQGLGIALIPRFLVEDELRSGQLIEVVRHAYLSDRSYYLIYPEHKSDNPSLAVFRDWLVEEAARYREAAGLA